MDACRRLFLFLWGVPAQLPVCKYQGACLGMLDRDPCKRPARERGSLEGRETGRGRGTGRGRQHTRFLNGTAPAAALPVSEGGWKVVGGGIG